VVSRPPLIPTCQPDHRGQQCKSALLTPLLPLIQASLLQAPSPNVLDPKVFRAPPSPIGLQRCARKHHSCLSSLLMAHGAIDGRWADHVHQVLATSGADLNKTAARPVRRSALLLSVVILTGCAAGQPGSKPGSPCVDGGLSCAAAETPPGMRQVFKGQGMARSRWVRRLNRESGEPDIGLNSEWAPLNERR
jgi:hypothetical protein